MNKKKYITTKEAAEILKLSHIGVKQQVQRGKYPSAIRCGCAKKNWLILESDVLAKLKKIECDPISKLINSQQNLEQELQKIINDNKSDLYEK